MSVVTTLNAIRATASNAYQTTVPLATMDNINEVGKAVLQAPPTIKNEFISALVNLVGLQLLNSREFGDSLLGLRKGMLEYGTTIEDIFVEMARPHEFKTGTRIDPITEELEDTPDQFAINKAITDTAFYYKIFERQYWKTIHEEDLKRAFYSRDGLDRFISAIMLALKNGEAYDDYRMTIALLARQIEQCSKDENTKWNGAVYLLTNYNTLFSKALTAEQALVDKDFLIYMMNQFKTWSNRLTKPRSDLNPAGVLNWLPKDEQRVLLLGDIQSNLDTFMLAHAYNAERLEVKVIDEIDCWYSIGATAEEDDDDELVVKPDDITVKAEMGVTDLTDNSVPCVGMIYCSNMVKIYTKYRITDTAKNARGHYYNVFDTVADYFACSPFENFVAFFLA